MRKLSFWARYHKKAARLIIFSSFLLLTIIGYYTGTWMNDLGISLSETILFLAVFLYIAGVIAYPQRYGSQNRSKSKSFYIHQKICDTGLAVSTFLMIVYLANQPGTLIHTFIPANAISGNNTILPKDSSAKTYKSIREFSASIKDKEGKLLKWKERKKLLKEQVRSIKKADNLSKGDKAGLIVLAVIVALGLAALVGALACELSCNGSEGAALLVGIGGTALIIFLLIITIRAIKRGKKEPKEAPTTTN
ncbi:MAG TPA: hypothetical protein PK092_08525 [Chitinophagaceae bacterium]|nr:hypothetical protein [Chitinophagaceae bacterium]